MGDSEQLCVNKEHGSFDGHGDNYCLMKCSLNNNAIFDRNNNMFTIKWVQYRWRKQLADNPVVLCNMKILVWKWASNAPQIP
jgi:hypothetical protein